jgi:hypothetical protein
VFSSNEKANLIYFNWSGVPEAVLFPAAVGCASLGADSREFVRPIFPICTDVEWLCLTDVLLSFNLGKAAVAASLLNSEKTILELQSVSPLFDQSE